MCYMFWQKGKGGGGGDGGDVDAYTRDLNMASVRPLLAINLGLWCMLFGLTHHVVRRHQTVMT